MNNTLHQSIFGSPKVRKTWKHTLSPEKNQARIEQMRFMKMVKKLLGPDYQVEFHFNPGGPAVWGETYVHVYWTAPISVSATAVKVPVVEACLSVEFSYIRQWDGAHSGQNIRVRYGAKENVTGFVGLVQLLANRPFVKF